MKKFFVAFLLIAIAAGNVFAEVTFSGEFFGSWDVIAGESGKTRTGDASTLFRTNLGLSGPYIRTRLNVTAANEDNTFGGWFRIQESAADPVLGWVWWQPISQVKATLGLIDGFRPFSRLRNLDVEDFLGTANYTEDIFPAYDAKQGFSLLLTPIANLKIGLSTPILGTAKRDDPVGQPAEVSYRRIGGWVNYTLDGIGDIALGFKGSSKDYTNGTDYGNGHLADAKSAIHLGFNLTAVDNLKFNFGAAYPIPQDTDGADGTTTIEGTAVKIKSVQNPIIVSLAADYTIEGSFGVRALASVSFGGKVEGEMGATDVKLEQGLVIGATLYPWVNIGVGNVGLVLSLKSTGESKGNGTGAKDGKLDLDVTPYFWTTYGGGSFYAGVRINLSNYLDDSVADDEGGLIKWAIPIGLKYAF